MVKLNVLLISLNIPQVTMTKMRISNSVQIKKNLWMGEKKEINTVCSPGADFSRNRRIYFFSLKLFCIPTILNNQNPILTGLLKINGTQTHLTHFLNESMKIKSTDYFFLWRSFNCDYLKKRLNLFSPKLNQRVQNKNQNTATSITKQHSTKCSRAQ